MTPIPIIVTDSGELYATGGRTGSEAYEIKKAEAARTLKRHGLDDISWYVAVKASLRLSAEAQGILHLIAVQIGVVEEVERLPPQPHVVLSVEYPLNVSIGGSVTDEQLVGELTQHLTDNGFRFNEGVDLIVCQSAYLNHVQQVAAAQGLETEVLAAIN